MDYRGGSIIGLLVLILDIYVIIEIFKSGKDMTTKILWTLLILFFPIVGLIIYLLLGRNK
jgi:putative effector of murein hydrolase LrgA (UPF0299 family)